MPFELIHVRHRPREKIPVIILSSSSHHFQSEQTEALARLYITNCSRNSDVPSFVVFFGPDDMPREAFAVRRGKWRDLDLIKAAALPDDPSTLNLYSGSHGAPPYLVTRW